MVHAASAVAFAAVAFNVVSTMASPTCDNSNNLMEQEFTDFDVDAREFYDFNAREFSEVQARDLFQQLSDLDARNYDEIDAREYEDVHNYLRAVSSSMPTQSELKAGKLAKKLAHEKAKQAKKAKAAAQRAKKVLEKKDAKKRAKNTKKGKHSTTTSSSSTSVTHTSTSTSASSSATSSSPVHRTHVAIGAHHVAAAHITPAPKAKAVAHENISRTTVTGKHGTVTVRVTTTAAQPACTRAGRGNEISAAGIASLFLLPPTYPSLDPSSRSVPKFHGVDVRPPLPNGNPAPVLDAVQPTHLHSLNRTRGGFDVTQLPVEIICEIFEKFMEDDLLHPVRRDTSVLLVSHTCRSDPTKLGQICSRWRPSHQCLAREVGNTPLNLEISYDSGKRTYDIGAAAQILESFIAHLGRWKKFHLNVSMELLGPLYGMVDSPHKPLLLESEVDIDAIWKYFHSFPTLRQVVWHSRELTSFPKHAPSQLTHVHARFSVSINDILSFLPQIPLIQELQIESLRRPSKNPPVTASLPLLLQDLRVLRIRSHEVAATSFLARLTCPSLESLEINHSNHFLLNRIKTFKNYLAFCVDPDVASRN
ncbi:hypothetical protein M413DRAFT_31908 [Hebeloma cylindrosporum]|uniref:F-box domain-containing protein n=1 Tax=Hebeloma cylindrosporum TaxID=76867 RepID=A0A0C3BHI0_HEBCY|nr:hypothetical protein M413DRAFT_31908 [Hebeloma cylindrosporum h7]